MNSSPFTIMKRGSKTYFYSSLFFPSHIRKDVLTLYAFVRTVDNFVDTIPQNKDGFQKFKKGWYEYLKNGHSSQPIITHYGELSQRLSFSHEWTDAFLTSMENDLNKKTYTTLKETESYMYGSAEVIGFMMASILHLPKSAYHFAALQGKAMQYINFLRDIKEDNSLGRTYVPQEILETYSLPNLLESTARMNKENFASCIRSEIARYRIWQQDASVGFKYIPPRSRIPIETAAIMYGWSAERIYKNPFIVYSQKVKPSILYILVTALTRSLYHGKIF